MSNSEFLPAYRFIINYDIRPENQENYYQFVMGEFIPAIAGDGNLYV